MPGRRGIVEPPGHDPPELLASFAGMRGEPDHRHGAARGALELAQRRGRGAAAELVDLRRHQHGRPAELGEEGEELDLVALEPAANVHKQDDAAQRLAAAEITLDERAPALALALGPDG